MSYRKNQILFDALENAALSMNMILRSETKISNVDFSFNEKNDVVHYSDKLEMATHVLRTNVVGNHSGTSYLILGASDVSKIHYKCLPKEVVEKDSAKNKALKGGLLLELDNMVAAGIITVIANQLDTTIYGDVPKLQVLSTMDVNSYMAAELKMNGYQHCIKAVFQIENLDITLDFIMAFERSFFEQLIEYKQEVA